MQIITVSREIKAIFLIPVIASVRKSYLPAPTLNEQAIHRLNPSGDQQAR